MSLGVGDFVENKSSMLCDLCVKDYLRSYNISLRRIYLDP